jgi:hypothetical protein
LRLRSYDFPALELVLGESRRVLKTELNTIIELFTTLEYLWFFEMGAFDFTTIFDKKHSSATIVSYDNERFISICENDIADL